MTNPNARESRHFPIIENPGAKKRRTRTTGTAANPMMRRPVPGRTNPARATEECPEEMCKNSTFPKETNDANVLNPQSEGTRKKGSYDSTGTLPIPASVPDEKRMN